MPFLAAWLFSMFQMEPPIGDAKVLIKNGIRIAFWIFNIIFNLKFLVISDFFVYNDLGKKKKDGTISHPSFFQL